MFLPLTDSSDCTYNDNNYPQALFSYFHPLARYSLWVVDKSVAPDYYHNNLSYPHLLLNGQYQEAAVWETDLDLDGLGIGNANKIETMEFVIVSRRERI